MFPLCCACPLNTLHKCRSDVWYFCRATQGENRPIVFDAPADLLDLGGLTDLQLSFIGGVSYAPLVIVISRIASRETDDGSQRGRSRVDF